MTKYIVYTWRVIDGIRHCQDIVEFSEECDAVNYCVFNSAYYHGHLDFRCIHEVPKHHIDKELVIPCVHKNKPIVECYGFDKPFVGDVILQIDKYMDNVVVSLHVRGDVYE